MRDQVWVGRFYDDYGEREWQRLDAEPRARVIYHLHRLVLQRHVRAGDRVLDLGAGAGRFTRAMLEMGAAVTAGDLSRVQLHLLGKHAPTAAALQLTGTALPFGDGCFDCAVCYGSVLSHLGEQAEVALAELVRVTRLGGHLLVSVVSTRNYFLPYIIDAARTHGVDGVGVALRDGRAMPDASGIPWRQFSAADIEVLAGGAGCEVVSLTASNVLATVPDMPLLEEIERDAALWQAFLSWESDLAAQRENVDRGSHVIAVLRKT